MSRLIEATIDIIADAILIAAISLFCFMLIVCAALLTGVA